MFQTIQVSTCISVQGEYVGDLDNGDVVIRDGKTTYSGRPIGRVVAHEASRVVPKTPVGALS